MNINVFIINFFYFYKKKFIFISTFEVCLYELLCSFSFGVLGLLSLCKSSLYKDVNSVRKIVLHFDICLFVLMYKNFTFFQSQIY